MGKQIPDIDIIEIKSIKLQIKQRGKTRRNKTTKHKGLNKNKYIKERKRTFMRITLNDSTSNEDKRKQKLHSFIAYNT